MHIGIDASSWHNERGFGRFTRCLVAALAARDTGMRYTLLFDQEPTIDTPDGVAIEVAGSQSIANASGVYGRSGNYMLRMGAAARRLDSDVFFFPTVYSYFPLFSRVPKVICYHDTIPERFPDLIFPSRINAALWKAKTLLAKWQATRVMTASMASADDLGRFLSIPCKKIDLVTAAADPSFSLISDKEVLAEARKECGVPGDAKLLVYVGGFNRHKNVIRLIEAMPQVLKAHPNAYLAIVGRTTGARFWDNIEELKASAATDAQSSGRIGFTGEISDALMAKLLNSAEALVFPSLWEGFGLPAVEAMACHTPVLSSDRGSLPEVVGDGGILFDPTDADAIAGEIIRFLGDDLLRARLKASAAKQAALFSWDRAAEMSEVSFRRAAGLNGAS
jgi:alpha-1,3-rhamnosyl/mannosyltransferase